MLNLYWKCLCLTLPAVPDGCGPWRRLIDTFQKSPSNVLEQEAETTNHTAYRVQSRSIVVMTTGHCGTETFREA
jgi:isoamylase